MDKEKTYPQQNFKNILSNNAIFINALKPGVTGKKIKTNVIHKSVDKKTKKHDLTAEKGNL